MTDLIKATPDGFSVPKLQSFNFRSCVLDLSSAFLSVARRCWMEWKRRAIVGGLTSRRGTVFHVQLLSPMDTYHKYQLSMIHAYPTVLGQSPVS